MVRLVDRANGKELGTIQDTDFDVLRRALEEEGPKDADYYITEETLELLIEQGLSPMAQALIRKGLEGRSELDLGWERA